MHLNLKPTNLFLPRLPSIDIDTDFIMLQAQKNQ